MRELAPLVPTAKRYGAGERTWRAMFAVLIAVLLCSFCHAPEHAYDELGERPEISRDGLCGEARERLLMATTERPVGNGAFHYAWDEATHAWRVFRERVACLLCDASSYKPTDGWSRWAFCCACRAGAVARIAALRFFFDGAPLDAKELDELKLRPVADEHLLFNDVAIAATYGLDALPGRRAWRRVRYPRAALVGPKPRGWKAEAPR